MPEERALVGNASDAKQVREAAGSERRGRDREINDLLAILDTREGRRFVWRLLDYCSVFTSVFSESPARTSYNSGRQDVGHFVLGEIDAARPEALIEMMRESKKEKST